MPADMGAAPVVVRPVQSVDHGLRQVAAYLVANKGKHASKDRMDLNALARHTGKSYAQTLTVPDAVFADIRDTALGCSCHVLSPPDNQTGEAVVMLADSHGALKGLPENKRASMLGPACGLAGAEAAAELAAVRGDAFVFRVRLTASKFSSEALGLGADARPDVLVGDRAWMEAAQAANKAVGSTEQVAVVSKIKALVEASTAAALAEVFGQVGSPNTNDAASAAASAATSSAEGLGKMSWVDGDGEVVVKVRVPKCTMARDVRADIGKSRLKVQVATLPADTNKVVVDGELFQPVVVDESSWSLESGKDFRELVIELQKVRPMRWLVLTR
eukprot:SAG31_NODE_3985_length_3685_cov_2.692694_4_plen_331_part_00